MESTASPAVAAQSVPPKKQQSVQAAQKESVKKWGKLVAARFTLVPAVLLERQEELGLEPVQMNILLQLLCFWWRADDLPWPSKKTLADRLGVDPATIRRHITEMEKKGLLERHPRRDETRGQQSNSYSLKPLARKLRQLAEESRKQKNKKQLRGASKK